jgi:hypothetical protein
MRSALRFITERCSRDGDVLVLLPSGHHAPLRDWFESFGTDRLASAGADDRLIRIRTVDDLVLREGRLFTAGDDSPIAAVIDGTFPSTTREQAFATWEACVCEWFHGPLSNVFSDKRLFARAVQTLARDGDRETRGLVERHCPWTRVLAPGSTTYEGAEVDLIKLILGSRERFVLKPPDACGGLDVSIGADVTGPAWEDAVGLALREGGWVVQERVAVQPMLRPGPREPEPYLVVWGVFSFGSRCGGVFPRLMPAGRGGVINVSRGAERGVALEISDPDEEV